MICTVLILVQFFSKTLKKTKLHVVINTVEKLKAMLFSSLKIQLCKEKETLHF